MALNSFDRVAHIYDGTRAMPPDVDVEVGRVLAAEFRRAAPEPRVFELAIGTGRIAAPLAAHGIRVSGVDISPRMLAVLRSKPGQFDPVLAEATRLPFRPASFDGALFVHILHLVPDPVAAVRATAVLVRPGGILIHGGTRHSPSRVSELEPQLKAITLEVTGEPEPGSERNARADASFLEVAEELGATVEERAVARWPTSFTPRAHLEELRNKVHSNWWSIPDEYIPEIARRTEAFLLEQFDGDLDALVTNEGTFAITVATLPTTRPA